jgi:hypothetical protein
LLAVLCKIRLQRVVAGIIFNVPLISQPLKTSRFSTLLFKGSMKPSRLEVLKITSGFIAS